MSDRYEVWACNGCPSLMELCLSVFEVEADAITFAESRDWRYVDEEGSAWRLEIRVREVETAATAVFTTD